MIKDGLFQEFGFNNYDHFVNSLIRPNMISYTVPFSVLCGTIEFVFGVKPIVLIALSVLLTIELVSGIYASYLEGQKIESKRMKSFLVMIGIWLAVLFILNTFKSHFGGIVSKIFDYLFTVVLLFINAIYFKSVWENAGRIMNKKDEFRWIIGIFSKFLKKSK